MSVKALYAGYRENNSESILRLKSSQRAALNWAAIEEHDTVLDLNCNGTAMLTLLKGCMNVHCCALCGSEDEARYIREYTEDIPASVKQDTVLPYRNGFFHVVIGVKRSFDRYDSNDFRDILRVMRPGAQLVLTAPWTDAFRHGRGAMARLQEAGFKNISLRFSGLNTVIMAWKKDGLAQEKQ